MPGMDGTGPWGNGQSGRGMGTCRRAKSAGRGRGFAARCRRGLTDNA
ncbi:MAG: DUF5320 domain-containing protein, partial [Candidatus Cloacimonetes bacterium]|nr:DUF5320 domain-containing protein [Candidatus Cloacimonadota bacterium]